MEKPGKLAPLMSNVHFVGGRRHVLPGKKDTVDSSGMVLITLVLLANFCAVLFMLNNIFILSNENQSEHILEQCRSPNKVGVRRTVRDHYLCHLVDIWKQYELWYWWDTRFVSQTVLLSTLLLAAHFVASSGLMLFGGIVNRKYSAFLPFIVVTLATLALLLFLFVSEMARTIGAGPMLMASQMLVALSVLALVAMLVWMLAIIACIRTRENQPQVSNVYARF